MRALLAFSVVGLVAGVAEPQLAQSVGVEPLDPTTQLGICGLLGGIVLALVMRTIPALAKTNAEAIKDAAETTKAGLDSLGGEISGLRSDFHEQADRVNERAERLNDTLLEALSIKKP